MFTDFLKALHVRGKGEKADALQKQVYAYFQGALKPSEVDALTVDEIVGAMNLSKILASFTHKQTAVERRVAELRAQGFTVSLGEAYAHGHNYSSGKS